MAENVQITPGTGVTIGADSVIDGTLGNAQIQYIKIMDGSIGGTNKAGVTVNGLAVDGSAVTQPISAASLPLPTGAATEATLASINTNSSNLDVLLSTRASELTLSGVKTQTDKLTFVASRLLIDGSGVTQPISALSLPLPTGAATETTLSAVLTNTNNLDVALSTRASELTLTGVKTQTDKLTFVSSRLLTDGSGVTQPVSGTVAATQSGSWTVSLTSGSIEIGTVDQGTPAVLANAWPILVTDGTNTLSLTALGEAKVVITEPLPAGTNALGSVSVSNFPSGSVTTSNITSVVASTSSVVLLPANASRRSATIFNDSTSNMFVSFGSAASLSNFTVRLKPTDYYEFPLPVFLGSVNAIWTTATGNARITEFS